jgi:hypothetical protein
MDCARSNGDCSGKYAADSAVTVAHGAALAGLVDTCAKA